MPRLTSSLKWLRLLREVSLGDIRKGAEAPFRVLLTGDQELAWRLRERLAEAPGHVEGHPWVQWVAPPAADVRADERTVAVVVVGTGEAPPEVRSAIEGLRAREVPTLTVVVDDRSAAEASEGDGTVRLQASLTDQAIAERLAPALLELTEDEDLQAALGRQLPVLRSAAAERLTEGTARANAIYATTTGLAEFVPVLTIPLTAADIVVLTKNQVVMAYRIALVAGKQGRPMEVLGEMLSVVGGGLFFRQVARELVGLLPVVGLVPKVAVAYAGTKIIGLQVRRWALEGRVVGTDELAMLKEEALAAGKALAGRLIERGGKDDDAPPAPDTGGPVAAAQPDAPSRPAGPGRTYDDPAPGEPIPMPDGDGRDVLPGGSRS